MEISFVAKFQANNPEKGYNLTSGGSGFTGHHSKESKKKISLASSGRRCTEEAKKKISAAHTGKIVSEKTRRLLSEAFTKTHCKRGHPLSGDNVRTNYLGHRFCVQCNKEKNRENYYKRKAAGLTEKERQKTRCKNGHNVSQEGSYRVSIGYKVCRKCGSR